jgi:DNA repair protein RecO
MAHHVYNTEGFVIESTPRGEANKMYLLFTKELGMVRASAQGVRLLKSKLRFAVQDFSYARFSLVRGRDMWKLTNAKPEWNLYARHKDQKAVLYACAHIFVLLRRLIPGEEKNEPLYTFLSEAFDFLSQESLLDDDVAAFERIVVLTVLYDLGYGGTMHELSAFIHPTFSKKVLESMKVKKHEALREINRSLRETQL